MKTTSALKYLVFISGFLEAWCSDSMTAYHDSNPSDPEPVILMYGESHGISRTDLNVKERLPPLLSRKYLDVFSVDYHFNKGLIFYTGWGAVWRLPMDEAGENAQGKEVVGEYAGAATVAVDWERDRMYWTCPASRTVWRADLEGQVRELIIQNTGYLTRHNNLVVDPYMRYLFVATSSGYSLRTDLDGGHLVKLDHGLRVTSLALDIHTQRLYVSGARNFVPVLLSCDYYGREVTSYSINHETDIWVQLVSIDVFSVNQQPQVFWVHHGWQNRDSAWRVNISGEQISWEKEYTSKVTILDPETRIWCLKVCHPDVQTRPKYLESVKLESQFPREDMTDSNTQVSCAPAFHWIPRLHFPTIFNLLLTFLFQSTYF